MYCPKSYIVSFFIVILPSEEYLKEHSRALQADLIPITREITDSLAKSRDELETLYGKIVSYVLLHSRMGSPTDISTVRETAGSCFALTVSHLQSVEDLK